MGDVLDRDDRRARIENERAERAQKELSYTAIAPAVLFNAPFIAASIE